MGASSVRAGRLERIRGVPPQQLSDWWTRAGAFLLDQLILAAAALAIGAVVQLVSGDPGRENLVIGTYTAAIALGLIYAPLLMARPGARNGQTFGKQIVGIRVVRTDGAPVGVPLGLLRSAIGQQLPIALTAYVWALVDYLWPLRDPRRQALHDKLARTWVVRAPEPPPSPFGTPSMDLPLPLPEPDEEPVQGWLPPRAPR